MKLEQRYSAGIAITYQGKILLGHTTGRKAYHSYGISKGGIEEGESILDAAIRETEEEFGIKVPKKLIGKKKEKLFQYELIVLIHIICIVM